MYRIRFVRLLAITVCTAPIVTLAGEDWPQFRGPNRNGMSVETSLQSSWAPEGPKEVWRQPLGEGYSAICRVGDRLYTMYAAENDGKAEEMAVALDAATGTEIWRTPLCERYDTEFGNGPRSTPTVVGDKLYVLTARGDLAALKTEDGSVVWQFSAPEKLGSSIPGWGYSTSPVVDGSTVIVDLGGTESRATCGIDASSGDIKWHYDSGRAMYNSLLPIEVDGKQQFVTVYLGKLVGISPQGEELWQHPWPQAETHAMPVLIPPNRIFASGVEGAGAAVVELNGNEPKEIWKSPVMRNHFSTSIYYADHIFGFDNATLKCISATDGSLAWAKRGFGKGSMIMANGQIYLLSDRGALVLFDATKDGFQQKGKVQALQGRCWTAPSLSHGRLYLRNHEEVVCYDISS
ncbi:MAG: PQQ-like beta-propeller repeat protein [Acidobacteria bacterium]|nr:PQQ-like beta-propeller repeat protein [Acidobacteriota bacterium]